MSCAPGPMILRSGGFGMFTNAVPHRCGAAAWENPRVLDSTHTGGCPQGVRSDSACFRMPSVMPSKPRRRFLPSSATTTGFNHPPSSKCDS